jgi:ABC-2 type transport system ATP-binding protein
MLRTDDSRAAAAPSGRDGPAIEARGLGMGYGDREVLYGIELLAPHGLVVGFLGPNGAGKTTTVEILEGYRRRTTGQASVLGMGPATGGRELRERIGIVLQETGHNPDMTVRETVRQLAGYYRRPRPVDEVVGRVGDPEPVFLDEPTTRFDPAARRQSWELIESLRDLGKTILLTTHNTDEAQALNDRVPIMAAGRIVADGTPAELPRVSGGVATRGRNVEISTDDPTGDLLALTGWAAGRGAALDGLTVTRPSLEDIYLTLTGDTEEAA